MKPTIIVYTHTDYKDIWPLLFGQSTKYLEGYQKILFVNQIDSDIPKDCVSVIYDEQLQYTDRVESCLKQIDEQVILYMHEDMFLYNEPNHQLLEEFSSLIEQNSADFIRLLKNSETNEFYKTKLHKNLVKCPKNSMFAIQPTLTTTEKLKFLCRKVSNTNIWNFEINASQVCIDNGLNKCFMSFFMEEPKRGLYHWDSFVFPYVATAIVKGKWNFLEYSNELEILLDQYNIDKNLRGIFLLSVSFNLINIHRYVIRTNKRLERRRKN